MISERPNFFRTVLMTSEIQRVSGLGLARAVVRLFLFRTTKHDGLLYP